MQELNHLHILVKTEIRNPPTSAVEMDKWLLQIVEDVGMKVLMGPFSTRCDTVGNEGVTGAVVIETSHLAAHCWDKLSVPFMQFDLYSCKDFNPEVIVNTIKQFDPYWISILVVDRNKKELEVIYKHVETYV